MKTFRNCKFILLLFLSLPALLLAQEKVVGLEENPVLRKESKILMPMLKAFLAPDTLDLPFFDDFSRETVYPSPERWEDQDVFVNSSYGINPPSIGVATFDVLDSAGLIYDHANTYSFIADHLTSNPIDLTAAGSEVYLSFYYQPMGHGDYPQTKDSLILEFIAPTDTAWNQVWVMPGPGNDTLQDFKQVIIHVDSLKYLDRGFRFRFFNTASISEYNLDPGRRANSDHWSIDYILLDSGRFPTDTVPHDVVMAAPLQSVLNNHESMPWKQFNKNIYNEMGGSIPIRYTNLDSITRNVTRDFQIWDVYDDLELHSYSAGALNISPWQTIDYQSDLVKNFETSGTDSALFIVKAWLVTDDFDEKINDTVFYEQYFGNYFAYDDGTAEAGYGLSGEGSSNMSVAYQFRAYLPDSLQAVNIFFNRSYLVDVNDLFFHLTVWDSDNGLPGNILYSKENLKPEFEDSLNIFVSFPLDEPVLVDGIFFVGWQQTSDVFLNVGFDKNRIKNSKLLYRKNGEWYMSNEVLWPGALMIRPVIGNSLVTEKRNLHDELVYRIYPNPVSDVLRIHYGDFSFGPDLEIRIYDAWGRILGQWKSEIDHIDVSSYSPGLYIFELRDKGKRTRKKFIKIH